LAAQPTFNAAEASAIDTELKDHIEPCSITFCRRRLAGLYQFLESR
jgi:hypothetical protein